MSPKKHEKIIIRIRGLGSHGEGIGDHEGYTIFVDDALPEERVEVELHESKKRYGKARLLKILEPSKNRVHPICPLFGSCGGCQLMHLSYAHQLEAKQQRVKDTLLRLGKISNVEVMPCMPSPTSLYYRNKIQCPVRKQQDKISIGLYARSSHDLVEVEKCYIHCSLGETVYEQARKIILESKIQAYEPATGLGELRHLLIKSAVNSQQVLIILVTHQLPSAQLKRVAKKIKETCPAVKGVIHNFNPHNTNVILGPIYETLEGQDAIQEYLMGLTFKISPASFFQVNTLQAEAMYTKALELAKLKGNEKVLDAYCGVGTLSLIFAGAAKNVIGIECVSEAVTDAKFNAKLNSIENTEFICAHVENVMDELINLDVVLLNPPRKGCEMKVLQSLIRLKPRILLYISCDPATLARDLSFLCNSGYRIDIVQPFDMFPQTIHVETLVKLSVLENGF